MCLCSFFYISEQQSNFWRVTMSFVLGDKRKLCRLQKLKTFLWFVTDGVVLVIEREVDTATLDLSEAEGAPDGLAAFDGVASTDGVNAMSLSCAPTWLWSIILSISWSRNVKNKARMAIMFAVAHIPSAILCI